MAAFFRRNDNTTIAELEEYYANRKSSSARAWVMSFLSLIITIAVVLLLFFAGRWIWRSVFDSSNEPAPTTNGAQGPILNDDGSLSGDPSSIDDFFANQDQTNNQNNSGDDANNANRSNDVAQSGSSEEGGVVSDEAATTTTPNRNTAGTTGGGGNVARTAVPTTGPENYLLAVPLLGLLGGYFLALKRHLK